MTVDVELKDPAILVDPDSVVKSGNLVRTYYGKTGETVQVGQGFVDLNTPDLDVSQDGDFTEGGTLNSRADDLLLNTRAEHADDILPLSTSEIGPTTNPVEGVTPARGVWTPALMLWPELFFPGTYTRIWPG
jgi:hypothetical protein